MTTAGSVQGYLYGTGQSASTSNAGATPRSTTYPSTRWRIQSGENRGATIRGWGQRRAGATCNFARRIGRSERAPLVVTGRIGRAMRAWPLIACLGLVAGG